MGKGVKAGAAFVEILANTTKFEKGLKRAQARMKAFGSGVQSIGLKVAAAGVAMTAPFVIAGKVFAKMGDDLEKMSRRTGVAVESLSALGFAAEQSGSDIQTLEKGIKTMQRSVVDLSRDLSTQKDAFEALGLVYDDIKSLKPEDQFKLIAERVSKIEDPTKRAATSLMIFGRAGAQLLPLMEDGAEGIQKLQNEAADLGIIISADQAKEAAEFTDNINRLFRVVQKGVFEIGQSVAPVISEMISKITDVSKSVMDWIKDNRNLIATSFKVAVAVAAIGTGIAAIGTVIIGASAVLGIFASTIASVVVIVSGLATAFLALLSPIGLMVGAIVAAGIFIIKRFDLIEAAAAKLGDMFEGLKNTFGSAFDSIINAVKGGNLEGAFNVLMASLDVIVKKGIAILISLWNDFKIKTVQAAADAVTGILQSNAKMVRKMRLAFVDITTFALKQFTKLKDTVSDIFDEIVGFLAKAITTDVRVKAQIDSDTTKKISDRASAQAETFKELEEENRQDKREIVSKSAKKVIEDIVSNLKVTGSDAVKKANADLVDAQNNLQTAISDVGKKTEEQSEQQEDTGSSFDEISNAIKNFAAEEIQTGDPLKLAVQGGFNPFGLNLQSSDFQNQMLKSTKDNEKNTRKLARNQSNGGRFA